MNLRKISFLLLIFLSVTVFLQAVDPRDDGDFIMIMSMENPEMNPLYAYSSTEAQLFTALYEGLFSYNPLTLEPMAALAKYWDVSEDHLEYTFYLREDGLFWNGDRITAKHFRDSWLKAIDPDTEATYSFLFDVIKGAKNYRLGNITNPEEVGINVQGDYELHVTLSSPAEHFFKLLSHYSFAPIHPSFLDIEDWSDFSSVIGNGPYYVLSRNDKEMILKKSNLYWDRDNVAIDKIRIITEIEQDEGTELFNSGSVLWATDSVDFNKVDPSSIVINPMFSTNFYFFRCDVEPWDNPLVRKSLVQLIPWSEIRVESRLYVPSRTIVPIIGNYPEIGGLPEMNIEEALKTLKEEGFPGGEGLPKAVLLLPQGEESLRVGTIIKEAWEEHLAIQVEIEQIPYYEYYTALDTEEYTLGTVSWIGDYPDPLTFLSLWTTDSNLNTGKYSNEQYNKYIDNSMVLSGQERYEMLSRAEELILEEAAILPLYHNPTFNLVNASVLRGWAPNPLDLHPFKYFYYHELTLHPRIVSAYP